MERAGDPIPGSKYVRAFCRSCGDPMRVSKEIFQLGAYDSCSTCCPPPPSEATMMASMRSATSCDDGDNGSWHNAVRSLEDGGR